MAKRLAAVITVGLSAAVLAGCSSGGSGADQVAAGTTSASAPSPSPHHHHSATASVAATTTASPIPIPAVTKTVTASPTTIASTAAAQDLVASPKVRGELVAAGAASHQLSAADYTGLVPGQTYYGYSPATSTYWAGAGLVPSSSSMPAQVSVQDDGSYLLFTRPAGGTWSAVNVGLAGVAGATCPLTVPTGILAVWHWKAGSCRPPG